MGGLAESAPELAAEMRPRQPGGSSQVVHGERIGVPGVDEVSGAKQVALRRDEEHRPVWPTQMRGNLTLTYDHRL